MKRAMQRLVPIAVTAAVFAVGWMRLAGPAYAQPQEPCPPSIIAPGCPLLQCMYSAGEAFTSCSTKPDRCCQYVYTPISCTGTSQSCWGQMMQRELVGQYVNGPGYVYRCDDPPGVCTIHFPATPR
jgi:hypothetical protein